jgi:hypothetical protein
MSLTAKSVPLAVFLALASACAPPSPPPSEAPVNQIEANALIGYWEGTFHQHSHGFSQDYPMVLEVHETDTRDEVRGFLLWPQQGKSKTAIRANIANGIVCIREDKQVQGDNILVGGLYFAILGDDDLIRGRYLCPLDGDHGETFELHRVDTVTAIPDLAVPQESSPERVVTGTVVDAAGQPMARALVGRSWRASQDSVLKIEDSIQASVEGTFSITVRFHERPISLVAMDVAQEWGGLIILDKDTVDEPVAIPIGPLVNLHGTIGIKDSDRNPERTNVSIYSLPSRVDVASYSSVEGKFSFDLPPGDYLFWANGTDLMTHSLEFKLDAAHLDHNLGDLQIEQSIIAQHYGKAPPRWRVSDARGLPKEVTLEDLKGKWVLIEFWGHW